MDTELLRTFLEVSKTRHFGRAAENLHLTHSAISFRIRHLEGMVGVKLFNRQRHNLTLTPHGERLIPYAKAILTSLQMALQDVGVADELVEQLSLGGTPNIWDTYLQEALPPLSEHLPAIALRTEVDNQISLARALLEQKIDIAIVFDPPRVAETESLCIGEIELMLVSSEPGISADTVNRVGYVFVDWGTAFNVQHAQLMRQPVAPVLHTGHTGIALTYLLRKGGAAFLPTNLVQSHLDAGRLHRVEGVATMPRDLLAAFLGASERIDLINAVVAFLAHPANK